MQIATKAKSLGKEIAFRPMTAEDLGLMLEFIREHADYQNLTHELVATTEDLQKTFFCEHPRVSAMIAEWEGNPAGIVVYFYTHSTFQGRYGIYIEDVYVRPEYRGQGIGTEAFRMICQKALDENYGRVQWCVLTDNQPAMEFYNKLGARPLNEWLTYRLEDKAIEQVASRKAIDKGRIV